MDGQNRPYRNLMNSPPLRSSGQSPVSTKSWEDMKDVEAEVKKLDSLAKESRMVLLKISSVFPFDFFPDHISIDPNKVSVAQYELPWTGFFHSISIQAIKDIDVSSSILFSSLHILPDGYPGTQVSIHYLKKHEAKRARRIILGLMIARQQGINCEKIDPDTLRQKVEELGLAREVDQ